MCGIIKKVARSISFSSVGYDDPVGTSVTTWCREAALSEAVCHDLLFVAREAHSMLLGAACGRVAVTCQVLGPRCVVCVGECRLPRSDKVSAMMKEACTREPLLGPVGLAQRHVGRAHVGAGVCCFAMATCGSLAPCE